MGDHKQGKHLQRLRGQGKPQQATLNADGQKAEHGIGQGVLPQQRPLVHIQQQAKHKGRTNAHALRLVHGPEHQHHRQQVRHPGGAPSQAHVQEHV